jgi:hypothetical protein
LPGNAATCALNLAASLLGNAFSLHLLAAGHFTHGLHYGALRFMGGAFDAVLSETAAC